MYKTTKRKTAMLFIVCVVLSVTVTSCHPGIFDQDCDEFHGDTFIQLTHSVFCNIRNLL